MLFRSHVDVLICDDGLPPEAVTALSDVAGRLVLVPTTATDRLSVEALTNPRAEQA